MAHVCDLFRGEPEVVPFVDKGEIRGIRANDDGQQPRTIAKHDRFVEQDPVGDAARSVVSAMARVLDLAPREMPTAALTGAAVGAR